MMGSGVDIESTVKARDSRVDVDKLAKAEAKLKAKREKKKDKFVEYEESRLIKARTQQKSYEELFLEGLSSSHGARCRELIRSRSISVNPLNAAAVAKGKSKDVHVENIEYGIGRSSSPHDRVH